MRRGVARGLVAGLVAGAAVAGVSQLTRRRSDRPGRLIDWDEVIRLARESTAAGGRMGPSERRGAEARYARLAAEVEADLFAAIGQDAGSTPLPAFEALDRTDWAELNIGIVRRVAEPVLAAGRLPDSLLTDISRAGTDRYLAGLLGFLAGRVLGQFDPGLLAEETGARTGLYLVEPNVARFEQESGVDGDQVRRWLILHEATHAWQFSAHPWLTDYMDGVIQRVVELAGKPDQPAVARLLGLTVGLPAQWRVVREVQATMSLIEGYSNLVMNEAGRRILPDFDRLQAAHLSRSGRRSPLEVLFWNVTGLEMKLRQYREGEEFCRAVRDGYGMAVLNQAWEGREYLPGPDDLRDPDAWARRVQLRLIAGRQAG